MDSTEETTESNTRTHLRIVLPEEQPVLDRLYQLYRYDFSEFNKQDIDSDAKYPTIDLARYLEDDQYGAYFITVGDTLAGFALVNLSSHSYECEWVKNLDDFFILRKYRRKRIGTHAAHLLFSERPGLWQVNKRTYNSPAMKFWDRVVRDFTEGNFSENTVLEDIHIHIFRSGPNERESKTQHV